MSAPPEPKRSQSTTSLSRFYNGGPGSNGATDAEEFNDPRLDFCNSFWGQGERGYEVVTARLRGAARTIDELRAYWKERAAIEEDYAKRLAKLSKFPLGRDEIGDLASSLQNLLAETSQQASYHQALSTELRQSVEQPTAEFGVRLANLKKGLQGSIEKSFRNKGLQEGHVAKARDRYESDCLKLNSYSANSQLVQGKELEKLHTKLERVRQTIGANEQDFRQFVQVLQNTNGKWESEWKSFCDHVQDLEEDRLALMKDIIWAFANAVSQVCVEDDSSCERVREKLEQFEPQNDMVTFVKGWGTGPQMPDPPRFVNYSAGEYPAQPTFRTANFHRLSSKPPMSAAPPAAEPERSPTPEPAPEQTVLAPTIGTNGNGSAAPNGLDGPMKQLNLRDEPKAQSPPPPVSEKKTPFGGIALPGMAAPTQNLQSVPERNSSMPPPPVPPTMTMPEPRIPSRQGPPTPIDEEDPMAKALAELRRDPPPPGSVRRAPSSRRPESLYSASGSVRGNQYGQGVKSPASPAPGSNRLSYQQGPTQNSMQSPPSRASVDMTLSPPPGGHTAAALAQSMDAFRSASRGPDAKRQSVNYTNYADDVVGAHPSRPSSPAAQARGPSPAMMQPPQQPSSPAALVQDEVLGKYHQAFPGERSRSRAGSIVSGRSRAGSFVNTAPPAPLSPSGKPREAFAGIGAGGRSPSPHPPTFRTPSPSPIMNQGSLGPQTLGIALDERGGVAYDSKAEEYRRQYQQQQQQQQQQPQKPAYDLSNRPTSQYGQQTQPQQQHGQQSYGAQAGPKSPIAGTFANAPPAVGGNRPTSAYGAQQSYGQQAQQGGSQAASGPYPGYQSPAQAQPVQNQYYPAYNSILPNQQQQPPPVTTPATYGQSKGYPQQQPPPQQQQQQPFIQPQHAQQYSYNRAASPAPQNQYARAASPALQNQYARAASPAPQNQYARAASPAPQNQYARAASPAPQQQQYQGYGAPSPQPSYGNQQQTQYSQQDQRAGRSPSPQPNMPPPDAAPTGQWSTTGLPVLFYVKALYDYQAQSGAEFDFQAGDIIAVTSTPEDGWWSGELLDEARRIPGRNDFPSNFVCLF